MPPKSFAFQPPTTRLLSWRSHALPTSCWSSVGFVTAPLIKDLGSIFNLPHTTNHLSRQALLGFNFHFSILTFLLFLPQSLLILCYSMLYCSAVLLLFCSFKPFSLYPMPLLCRSLCSSFFSGL